MDFVGGFSSFSSAALLAFSGAATSPFDTYTQSDTTGQPGSITPAEGNELFVTAVAGSGTAPVLTGDFTTLLSVPFTGSVAVAAGAAYYISDNSNAVDPNWGSAYGGSVMAAFKAG